MHHNIIYFEIGDKEIIKQVRRDSPWALLELPNKGKEKINELIRAKLLNKDFWTSLDEFNSILEHALYVPLLHSREFHKVLNKGKKVLK